MLKEPACSPEGPRNIVVLSDGTGNSSGSVWRTNVWRMYEALDLSTGSQLALYDNGVGTSAFRPLAILGGALGWGLKRNVRDLYTFVCRNYRPKGGERLHADRIYAMGFSRGAFTIRVLVDLIGHQGLITGASGRELDRRAKWAYREYRKQFKSRLHLVSMCRWIRDKLLGLIERGKPKYDSGANLKVPVTFMGLWDTVDAYGLPIDEMTRGWDQWVWPLKMDSLTPPSHVNKICHAIALDDERHTFHPVLLDEANLKEHDHIDKETVTQVWFAGVHSNVGGSYPDDSLAHVPLRWMAAEAQKQGLHLHQVYTTVWEARCDPHGPIYDSRRGLGSYYRYNPRSIARLTKDDFAKVSIPRPKIHCSVFQRIAAGRDEYAPLVLPDRYAVVDDAGAVIDFDPKFGENHTQAKERAVAQERVWDRVWVRRVLYFATVITTVLVVLPPLIMDADSGGILPFLPWKPRTLQGAVDLLGNVVPSMLQSMVAYYRELPLQLFVPGGLILLLMFASTRVQRAAADRMRELWTGGGQTVGAQRPDLQGTHAQGLSPDVPDCDAAHLPVRLRHAGARDRVGDRYRDGEPRRVRAGERRWVRVQGSARAVRTHDAPPADHRDEDQHVLQPGTLLLHWPRTRGRRRVSSDGPDRRNAGREVHGDERLVGQRTPRLQRRGVLDRRQPVRGAVSAVQAGADRAVVRASDSNRQLRC